MTQYRLNLYMRIDPEEELVFTSRQDAESEKQHFETRHPRDFFEIEEIEGGCCNGIHAGTQ